MTDAATWLLWLVLAYLVGAIPVGLLLGWMRGVDLRKEGSGNLGATNAGRVLGRKTGILCFSLDLAKGLLPVLAFGLSTGLLGDEHASPLDAIMWLAIGAAAVAGHMFPIYLRFRGGKGVATGLGVVLGLWPMLTFPGLAAAIVWLAVVYVSAYVSLGSIVAALSLPLWTLLAGLIWQRPLETSLTYTLIAAALAALVVLRHRDNIQRLRNGSESRVKWARQKN